MSTDTTKRRRPLVEFHEKATRLLEHYCRAHPNDEPSDDYFMATVIPDGLTADQVRLDAIPLWRNAARTEGLTPAGEPHTITVEPFTDPSGTTMNVLRITGTTTPD